MHHQFVINKFEIATGLNKYFTEFGPNLASKLLKTAIDIYLISTLKPENTFVVFIRCSQLIKIDQPVVMKGISLINEMKATGPENLSIWRHHSYIINWMFEPSEFLQDIQISSMMAWYKKKGFKIVPSEIENYLWFCRFVCKLVQ